MKLTHDPFDPYFLKPTVPYGKQVLRNAIRNHPNGRLLRIARLTEIGLASLKRFRDDLDALSTDELQKLAKVLMHAEYDEEHNILVSYSPE
jgi:hypothetical protein